MSGSFYGPHSVVEPSDSEKTIGRLEDLLAEYITDNARLRAALERAAHVICDEFCSRGHHPLCVETSAALSLRPETEKT